VSKIILIGSAHPYRGGLAAYNERLAQALQDAGHEVTIYTFTVQYPNFLFPGKSQFTSEAAPSNITIKRKVNSVNPLNWLLVGNEIKNLKPDILLIKYWLPFMGPCFGTIARLAKRNHHTKVISILDNVVPHEKRVGDIAFTKYYIRACDAFVGMSQIVLDDLKQFDAKKPRAFNPHPLFDNFGKPVPKNEAKKLLGLDASTNYMLFFGFIRDYKGLDLLLEAFADERLRKFPLKLIIAGEFYSDRKKYDDLIEKFNLKDLIIQKTDFIPDSEVYKYFCAADIVVQPYKHATQSGVTQIAYQFNKPMIVTNVGGLAEIVPDGKAGHVVEPSPTAIANAIYDFYSANKENYFVDAIQLIKPRFEWKAMVKTIETMAQEIKR
jgi:glycosyltransferase involved in cell wall biosynthesis